MARFGGDDFAFIIRDVHGATDAGRAAGKLLARLRSPLRCAGHDADRDGEHWRGPAGGYG